MLIRGLGLQLALHGHAAYGRKPPKSSHSERALAQVAAYRRILRATRQGARYRL